MAWAAKKHGVELDPAWKLPKMRYKGDGVQPQLLRLDRGPVRALIRLIMIIPFADFACARQCWRACWPQLLRLDCGPVRALIRLLKSIHVMMVPDARHYWRACGRSSCACTAVLFGCHTPVAPHGMFPLWKFTCTGLLECTFHRCSSVWVRGSAACIAQ